MSSGTIELQLSSMAVNTVLHLTSMNLYISAQVHHVLEVLTILCCRVETQSSAMRNKHGCCLKSNKIITCQAVPVCCGWSLSTFAINNGQHCCKSETLPEHMPNWCAQPNLTQSFRVSSVVDCTHKLSSECAQCASTWRVIEIKQAPASPACRWISATSIEGRRLHWLVRHPIRIPTPVGTPVV